MKKAAMVGILGGLMLTGCGTLGATSGRINVGVAVGDASSQEVATVTVTPKTCDDKGVCTPEKRDVSIKTGEPVTFTFSTRPGSDAVTIEGYRILSDQIDGEETIDKTDVPKNEKMNLYVPSGYDCKNRVEGRSCTGTEADLVPSNGESVQHKIYFASGLGSYAVAKGRNVTRVTTLEFFGFSSNNVPFTKVVSGVVSRGTYLLVTQ